MGIYNFLVWIVFAGTLGIFPVKQPDREGNEWLDDDDDKECKMISLCCSLFAWRNVFIIGVVCLTKRRRFPSDVQRSCFCCCFVQPPDSLCRKSTHFWLIHNQFHNTCLWEKHYSHYFGQKFLTEISRKFLTDKHSKFVYEPVRSECSSCSSYEEIENSSFLH